MRTLVKRILPRPAKELLKRILPQRLIRPNKPPEWAAPLSDLEVAVRQLESILQCENGRFLPPPKHLQERVVGVYSPYFISSGYDTYRELSQYLASFGKQLADFPIILDFGCGCGRVIRALRTMLPSHALYGTDIDQEAIHWLKEHYKGVAEFDANPHLPPMNYGDATFDLIYSISIFTHLPEDMQFAWLAELQRVAKPGAHLLLTTHGEKQYRKLPPSALAVVLREGFCYLQSGNTKGLPDFYQGAYHSHEYIQHHWSRYFEIIDIKTNGLQDHQDIVFLRKRPG